MRACTSKCDLEAGHYRRGLNQSGHGDDHMGNAEIDEALTALR